MRPQIWPIRCFHEIRLRKFRAGPPCQLVDLSPRFVVSGRLRRRRDFVETPAAAVPLFEQPESNRSGLAEEARLRGEIYIARSLSHRPEIKKLSGHLFKIGFTTGTTEARIAAAKDDPTFLLAPAHPVKVFQVYDIASTSRFVTDLES